MPDSPHNISKIDLIIGQDGGFYVVSDYFFNKKVDWLEYYSDSKRLEFILEEGEVRELNVPVPPEMAICIEHQTAAYLIRGSLDDMQEHGGYALIVHR